MTVAPVPRSRGRVVAAVFVGGAVGAVARAVLAHVWAVSPGAWPWATFVANLVGCAVLGAAVAWWEEPRQHVTRRALVGPGFCGALTSFSTIQWEVVRLAEGGHWATAVLYVLASLALGAGAVHAADMAVREVRG